mmetsp:Transcript_73113/g.117897  ORF Transcript_73113/g.117897 Transcript_73113/m.117897 type:complete len:575 (+) Transcript_73113:89-1813(+)
MVLAASTNDDGPLLASPGPHVGSPDPVTLGNGVSNCSTAPNLPYTTKADLKRLLGSSPPPWAASPLGATEYPQPTPPPWPRSETQGIREWAPVPSFPLLGGTNAATRARVSLSFQEQEEEISRFLGGLTAGENQEVRPEEAWRDLPAGEQPQTPRTPELQIRKAAHGKTSPTRLEPTPSTASDYTAWSTAARSAVMPGGRPAGVEGSTCQRSQSATSASWETPIAADKARPWPVLTPSPLTRRLQQPLFEQDEVTPTKTNARLPDEGLYEPQLPCSCCGRNFREGRLAVHEAICFRFAQTSQQRSVFESKTQRCTSVVATSWWLLPRDEPHGSHGSSAASSPPKADRRRKSSPPEKCSGPASRGRGLPPSPSKVPAKWPGAKSPMRSPGERGSLAAERKARSSSMPLQRRPTSAVGMGRREPPSPVTGSLHASKGQEQSSGVLVDLMDDVSQLSAQVDRLLSRRSHVPEDHEHSRSKLWSTNQPAADAHAGRASDFASEADVIACGARGGVLAAWGLAQDKAAEMAVQGDGAAEDWSSQCTFTSNDARDFTFSAPDGFKASLYRGLKPGAPYRY